LAHQFFDDLRVPGQTLPDGKPLPADLLVFEENEIAHCSPQLLE
jgi:hypothetical protein